MPEDFDGGVSSSLAGAKSCVGVLSLPIGCLAMCRACRRKQDVEYGIDMQHDVPPPPILSTTARHRVIKPDITKALKVTLHST